MLCSQLVTFVQLLRIELGENLNLQKNCCVVVMIVFCQNLHAADLATVDIRQISSRTWTHTSYEMIDGYSTDANGMLIDCSTGLVLVDACWNDAQARTLLRMVDDRFHKPVLLAIITHSHSDRIGGIGELKAAGIKVVSTDLTAKYAIASGYPAPLTELDSRLTKLRIGDTDLEVFYPGAGHTKDNMVVWIPSDRILFGGCRIKSLSSDSLGNIADADLGARGPSVENLKQRYPYAKLVVPGHGQVGGVELLQHTIDLCARK
jgi:metallo-beta-lactamase class B